MNLDEIFYHSQAHIIDSIIMQITLKKEVTNRDELKFYKVNLDYAFDIPNPANDNW